MQQMYLYSICKKNLTDNHRHQLARIKLSVELRDLPQRPVLAISANYKCRTNQVNKDMGGQCLDEIMSDFPMLQNTEFGFWYRMWKLYHLNNMHAGTQKQENALKQAQKEDKLPANADYDLRCSYLKGIGLYEVTYHNKPYKYGSAWLYRAIAKEDLHRIITVLNSGAKKEQIIMV